MQNILGKLGQFHPQDAAHTSRLTLRYLAHSDASNHAGNRTTDLRPTYHPIAGRPTYCPIPATFSWKFDDTIADDADSDTADHGFVLQSFTEVDGGGPVLQVVEGSAPKIMGVAGVLLKKVVSGTVPEVESTTHADDLLPQYLHFTYLHPHTQLALHSIFHQVYLPICERLGKADRTAYLASLSHNFCSLSRLQTLDPPLDYDSDEEDGTQKQMVAALRESEGEMADQWKEGAEKKSGGGDEEEDEEKMKDPNALLVKNVNRHLEKYSQVNYEVTLEELQNTWNMNFMKLSSTLAHLHNHPLVLSVGEREEAEEEEEEEEEKIEEGKEEGEKRLQEAVVELGDLHCDLSDRYRSLSYLHKFIKVVSESKLASLAGHAPGLLDLLLLLWRLGRRHGMSGKVQMILESAVESLVELVTHELRPVNLLPSSMREQQPFMDSSGRVEEALKVVGEWEAAVESCEHQVSTSAKRQRDGRQDFDPKKVLPTITSLRAVCSDLSDIMKVLLEAQVGFSGEWSALIRVQDPDHLKSVTSQVLRVLTAYDFNIFSTRNQDRWVRQKEDFQLAVQKWEQAVSSAITESFKDRMTSELVTAVAGVLQKEPCRDKFRQMLISRLPDLLSAFAAEVKGIRADFQAQQQVERPGTQAPLSGRVRWMGTYLTKRLAAWTTLKVLYSQYQGSGAGGELWVEVGAEVEEVQKEVERAREQMVLEWGQRVTQQIPKLLVTPVLARDKNHFGVGGWRVQLPGELQSVVWESGQLLQAGIRPPELASHLTLHYQTLQTAAMGLHLTLKDYHSVLDQLSPIQRELLSAELSGADRVLAAGQRVVTWSPAALTHFSASCRDVIEHVRALANKLISISHHLEDYLATIQNTRLMTVSHITAHPAEGPPSLQELLEDCNQSCDETVDELIDTFEKLVTTLGSAGLLLAGAEEGAPEALASHIRAAPEVKTRLTPFLIHWEHSVQEAITMMLVNSISEVEGWLEGKKVVFGVQSNLTPTSTLTLTPPARTLTSTLADALGHTVRSAMAFRHWVELDDGTVSLNPAPTADDDTLAASTFYSQVSSDSRLHAAIENVQATFAKVIRELDIDLQSWYAYEHVWRRDKAGTVSRFCRSGPSVKEYDDKLRFYTHLASELSQASQQVTHGCVSLDVHVLVSQIVHHAADWVKLLGSGLLQEARSRLQYVLHQVTEVNAALHQSPDDLSSLTVVMRAVGRVSSEHANLHTSLLDVRQMFHTLHVYGIEVLESDHEGLENTAEQLEVLHHSAITVQKNVQPVQAFFLSNTKKKVAEFRETVKHFHDKFVTQGPGAVGDNLDKGVELLKEYSDEVLVFLKQRQELDEEEDIFDLAATQYPGLDNAILVLNQLKDVFNIYQQLRSIEMTWRTMRWSTAKLDDLRSQIEGVQRALCECTGAQETHVGKSLQQRLEDHINSLEVTAVLRQPAVQTRHWQHLVAVAGCGNKWASASAVSGVSVWDVLELRLSRHPLLVAATVASAVRESLLNNQIKEITNFWQRARLCVKTFSAVWKVEGLHELLSHLHHHNLALRALRSTRYCQPFELEASRLAKNLVMVGDLLEVWQDTQKEVSLLLSPTVSLLMDDAADLQARHRQLLERTERRAFVLELAGNKSYIQEISDLKLYAESLVAKVSLALSRPRHLCPRLHLLTDRELMSLMAEPTPEVLNSFAHKIFNNVASIKAASDFVTGLVSEEGEHLPFACHVHVGEESLSVGAAMQQLLDASHTVMKTAVQKAIEELGKEGKLPRQLLQEVPVSAVIVAWRVWWAACVSLAFHSYAKGAREALRQKLMKIHEDIGVLLAVMGRGQQQEDENEEQYQEEPVLPLSSMRTASGPSCCTTRRNSMTPVPATRCLPLLMAIIHARDVTSRLIRNNANCAENFTWISVPRYLWQSQSSRLTLCAADRIIEYGYEYSGCGQPDYVVTPTTERAMLAVFTASAAHTSPLLIGKNGGGKQSLVEAAARMAGRFTTTFSLSALTPSSTLTSLLAGSLIGGSWLFLRDCNLATPAILATLASTLLSIYHAHTYTSSSPVIQIDGQEVNLNAWASVIISVSAPLPTLRASSTYSLPYSLEATSRPIWISTPPAQVLVFAWLHALAVPKAQDVSEAIGEVVRQVLGSLRNQTTLGLRLQMRMMHEVVRILAATQYTSSALEAAVLAFKSVIVPRLPQDFLPAIFSVLNLLHPSEPASLPSPHQLEGTARSQVPETLLQKMGLGAIPQQVTAVEDLVRALGDWSCVVVAGPPRSGKTSVITAAIKLFQQEHGLRTSLSHKSTRGQGPDKCLTHRSQLNTLDRDDASTEEIDGVDIDILNSNRQLVDRQVYTLRPHSYTHSRLFGSVTQSGLLPRLLNQLALRSSHSFVVLEGAGGSECLLRLSDLPGTLLLDSLTLLPITSNLTFIVEVCSLDELPQWVLSRAGIVQVDPHTLSLSVLLPKPDLIPATPTSEGHSSSITPRSMTKPSTPVSRYEEPSPTVIFQYLLYRLLYPVLQFINEKSCGSQQYAVVDIVEQIENLSMSESQDINIHRVAEKVQAVIQISRSVIDPVLLPEIQQTFTRSLDAVVADGVLDASISEVLQSLSCSSISVYDQWWDVGSSSWCSWLDASPISDADSSNTTSKLGGHAIPSVDSQRLNWLLKKAVIIGRPLVVVGPPACGKTTAALLALSTLPGWVTVRLTVVSATTPLDLEETVLSHLSRAAYDTFIPSTPLVLCFDDIGNLSWDSPAWSYIQGLALHKGLYDTRERVRWMNFSHVYIVCVCTQEESERAGVKDFHDFSGWFVYNMSIDENTCTAALSAAFMPIAPLQSHIYTALLNTTMILAENLIKLMKCQEEPFAPANKLIILWHIAASVKATFSSLSLSSTSSSSGVYIFNTWLHAVSSQVLLSVFSNKLQGCVWHEIKKSIIQGCNGIVNVPKVPPVPVWPPGCSSCKSTPHDNLPKYLTETKASEEITKVLVSYGVSECVCGHRGVALGTALVVDAIQSLVQTHILPFLLIVGPSSGDKDTVVSLAATYLGLRKVSGDTEMEVLQVLKCEGSRGNTSEELLSSPHTLVHVPATFLKFSDVLKAVLKLAAQGDGGPTRLCVVTGSHEEVWPLFRELRPVAQRGRVVCLPQHEADQHESFVQTLLKKNKLLQNLQNQDEIANFITWVHESYCADERVNGAKVSGTVSSSTAIKHLPAVSSLVKMVAALAYLLQQRKNEVQSKLSELQTALSRVEELEKHVQGLRDLHGSLEVTQKQAVTSIDKIKENLKNRAADILTHERGVNELHKEAVVVEKAQEELSGEVAEYVEETKEPLSQITEAVAHLDIHRIRKLLSRSPISAIQIIFECAVVLLGSADMSWRAVRHAIQDDNFCSKLAAVCVPGLKQNVIATLSEKLEQIKMTSEHMSRVSDIGGVLLQYLRTVIFFWHRYHEDVQPRQARVQALTDQKKELQVEMATKERLVRVHKEEVADLKSRLKKEEERLTSLKKQNISVAEELERILAIISELNPHSERWRKEIEDQQMVLQQLMGECLLAAASLTYLTHLLPDLRDTLTQTWQNDLVSRGFLHPSQDPNQHERFRLVSQVIDLQVDVKQAVDYHINHNTLLLIHDPHYLVEEYKSGGIWLRLDKSTWQQELKERLRAAQECVIYLRTQHSPAQELVKCVTNLLKDFTELEYNQWRVLIIIEDDCISAPCPLCSQHTFINMMLDHKGIVHQLIETLIKWHDPRFEEEVHQVVQAVLEAYTEKKGKEAILIQAFGHASNLTSNDELVGIMHHIKELNDAITLANKHESKMNSLTSMVSDRYLHVACYTARLHDITCTLSALNSSYALPLTLIEESLAFKLAKVTPEPLDINQKTNQDDLLNQNEEIMTIVTTTVFELLDMRLQLQHRLIVTTCFALAKLNMKHDSDNYIQTFLVPMQVDEMVWGNLSKDQFAKKQECGGSKDDLPNEEEETGEQDEKENFLPNWIHKQCDKRCAHVLIRLSEKCSSLFGTLEAMEESAVSQLLLWLSRDTSSWPAIFPTTDALQQAAQRVILSRHLREDLLVEAMMELVKTIFGNAALKMNPGMLSKAILLHSRKQKTRWSGINNIIQVNVSKGSNTPRVLMEAAKDAGLPYYKLIFLSLVTASHQELRRRVVMAARRRTWLILLDCETAPEKFSYVQSALLTLPSTLTTPTVFCVVTLKNQSLMKCQNAIVAQVEKPVSLASSLSAYLPIAYTRLQTHMKASHLLSAYTQAAVLTTAYIYAVLHARGEQGVHGWMSCPPLTESLLTESLEFALIYACKSYMSWDVLANVLAKVVYGSVVMSQLDQQIINRIFTNHLNNQMFRNVSQNLGIHQQINTEYGEEHQPTRDEVQASDDARPILLHSFPSGDLTLNLQLPSHKAVEKLCEQVEEKEATLLGLNATHQQTQQTHQILCAMEAFTDTPCVPVAAWRVVTMIDVLESALHGQVREVAAQVTREDDLETEAWQQEAHIWDKTYDNAKNKLNLIKQAVMNGAVQPAQALLLLLDLVQRFLLHPYTALASVPHCEQGTEKAAQKNMVSVWLAKTVTAGVQQLAEEWRKRYAHLLTWASNETPPVMVHLGLMAAPSWWLTRLRQTVCRRAHWLLRGSLVYATTASEKPSERPPQGVFVDGIKLVGGCWTGSTAVPIKYNIQNYPIILSLCVSHSAPPIPVGHEWVPVLEEATSNHPLFRALLPLQETFTSSTPLYLLIH
ncbi:dynein axonemal heavy chain 10-like isoform X2 [Cherax quadricarinatus]|uniref:dynein axonemal heavy chain 10-like isoform X2 n=1 Tax=Cherax quadricarinatus TaxID=27406 RepID=UPI00387ED40B